MGDRGCAHRTFVDLPVKIREDHRQNGDRNQWSNGTHRSSSMTMKLLAISQKLNNDGSTARSHEGAQNVGGEW
jgi:hypothetical protein